MAAVSTLQYTKRKQNVYGKSSRANFSASFFDNDDEDELATAAPSVKPKVARQSSRKATYPLQKTEAKAHALKAVRSRSKKQDTFEVPFSDEEDSTPLPHVPPPKFKPPKLVDDRVKGRTELPPWEKRKLQESSEGRDAASKKTKAAIGSPEAQLEHDLARAATVPKKSPSATSTPKGQSKDQQDKTASVSPIDNAELKTTSAAARLAARKRLADSSAPSSADEVSKLHRTVPKRPVLTAEDSEGTPRKRARTTVQSRDDHESEDVLMIDSFDGPVCGISSPETKDLDKATDVFDFPESSADESTDAKSKMKYPIAAKKSSRRGKLTTYSMKSTPRKGVSAPARLAEMIATDTDTTEAPTRSPSASISRRTTPQQPSTPPSGRGGSLEPAAKADGTLTPRQAQLWNGLLPSDPIASSPSTLPMKDLSISAKRRTGAPSLTRRLTKSQSDITRRRTRLVDRLKASAPSSDDELSGEDEEDEETADVDVIDRIAGPGPSQHEQVKTASMQTSQSQSQTAAAPGGGPKITYSRMRSYLPEDNLGDDLMFGLTAENPQQPVATRPGGARAASNSQRSAFDLDDSDDEEGGPGKIRTIHELRASGRNIRGMEDIEDLLRDVENHAASNRSRRRSALIELATKLADKAFVERFVAQSFEIRLAAECTASLDEIADFVLAAALALVMAAEPPELAVRSLQDLGVVGWLAKRLGRDVEVGKLARERRNNMSKAGQAALMEFTVTVKKLPLLWNEEKPTTLTMRLVALKGLDQLISRLRRMGDKSALLSADELPSVLREPAQALDPGRQIELGLAISVLESLSTTSLSLDWPPDIVQRVGAVLSHLDTASPLQRHTFFLTLRLCLNLTNDNVRNCALLVTETTGATIDFLLQGILNGFNDLAKDSDDEQRTIALDLLVLAMGIMINLAEHSADAREQAAVNYPDPLAAIVHIFQEGQKHMLEAESVEESISNVAFGYLAVMLANLCQHAQARTFIAENLPRKKLDMLVEAVEEFVRHHQKVDMMNSGSEEGMGVWGAFTEKLKGVLVRLKGGLADG